MVKLIQLIFVDNIILFGHGSIEEWRIIWNIIAFYCEITCMEVSHSKSIMLTNGVPKILILNFKFFLPFQFFVFIDGIKYIGYHLNANIYLASYWLWMVKKVEC